MSLMFDNAVVEQDLSLQGLGDPPGETSQQPTARATASNGNRRVDPRCQRGLSRYPSGSLELSITSNPASTVFFLYIRTYDEV